MTMRVSIPFPVQGAAAPRCCTAIRGRPAPPLLLLRPRCSGGNGARRRAGPPPALRVRATSADAQGDGGAGEAHHARGKRISELVAEDAAAGAAEAAGFASLLHPQAPLRKYSTMEIGGPAALFAEVASTPAMAAALAHARDNNMRYLVIGKGSNCLFDDRGYDGLVVRNHIEFLEDRGCGLFRVGAGVAFNALGLHLSRAGWSGLEFASGVPGSVGGAVYMNAGADGQETFNAVAAVEAVDADGAVRTFSRVRGELPFSYRKSRFQALARLSLHGAGSACGARWGRLPSPHFDEDSPFPQPSVPRVFECGSPCSCLIAGL